MKEAFECLKIEPMAVILALLVLLAAGLAWSASRNPNVKFNFEDMFQDSTSGKTSLDKVAQFSALAVSTWGFVYLTLAYKLSEVYFTTYMVAWAGARSLNKWLDKKEEPK